MPVYVHQPVSRGSIVPPQRLVGWPGSTSTAGHPRSCTSRSRPSELAVTVGDIDGSGPRAVERGQYQVQVGSMSADFAVN